MFSIIGGIIFLIIALITLLGSLGLPVGEFIMGGKSRVLNKSSRVVAGIFFFIQLFAVIIILQGGGFIPLLFSSGVTKNICLFFSFYLLFNTVMNFLSKSKKEKCVMTPLSLIAAISFFITYINI